MPSELSESFRHVTRELEKETERKEHDSAIARCVTAVAVNDKGIIGRATPPLARLFGWLENELDGKPMEILLPERFRTVHGSAHLPGFFRKPTSRQMGAGTAGSDTQRTLLSGWNEREQREFPVVIGLEPQHYLDQNWAIGTLAQPVVAEQDWRELCNVLAKQIGIDLTGVEVEDAKKIIASSLRK